MISSAFDSVPIGSATLTLTCASLMARCVCASKSEMLIHINARRGLARSSATAARTTLGTKRHCPRGLTHVTTTRTRNR